MDILPTLASVARAEVPPYLKLDGTDILPVLAGKAKSPRQELFWQSRNAKAALIGHHKWVEAPSFSGLFDLARVPAESNDLSGQHPEIVPVRKNGGRSGARRWTPPSRAARSGITDAAGRAAPQRSVR